MDFKNIKNKVLNFVDRNKPTLYLVGAGIGFLGTIILASKAGAKSNEELKKAEKKKGDKLSFIEKTKIVAPNYIYTAASATATAACAIEANSIHLNRTAAALATAEFNGNLLEKYKENVKKEIGVKKEKRVSDEAMKEVAKERSQNVVILSGGGDYLCFEPYSKQKFKSTIEKVRHGINKASDILIGGVDLSLNEYLDCLNLPSDKYGGDDRGWNIDWGCVIEPDFVYDKDEETGEPMLIVTLRNPPRPNYRFKYN